MLDLTDREILQAASRIKRSLNRERRRNVLNQRPHEKRTRGRDIDNGFLAYLRRQPCEARSLGGCSGPTDPAHIRFNDGPDRQNPGGARKNHDRHANPLCRAHHDQQHGMNERRFWTLLDKDAYATAAKHYAAYNQEAR